MCDPIVGTALAVASAGMAIAQGSAANSAAKQEAKNAQLAGRQALQAGNIEAQQVRDRGSRELGSIRAIQSASGADLSSGSAADVGGRVALNTEHEALMKLYGGQLKNWDKSYEAQALKAKGKAAQTSGYISAATTLLGHGTSTGFFKSGKLSDLGF